MNCNRKFKIGDKIVSSLFPDSVRIVRDIRLGKEADFDGYPFNWIDEECYVMQFCAGRQIVVVGGIESVDNNFTLWKE